MGAGAGGADPATGSIGRGLFGAGGGGPVRLLVASLVVFLVGVLGLTGALAAGLLASGVGVLASVCGCGGAGGVGTFAGGVGVDAGSCGTGIVGAWSCAARLVGECWCGDGGGDSEFTLWMAATAASTSACKGRSYGFEPASGAK